MTQQSHIQLVLLSARDLSAVDVGVFCWPSGPLDQQLYLSERLNGVPDPLQLLVGLPVQHVHQYWCMNGELWNENPVMSLEADEGDFGLVDPFHISLVDSRSTLGEFGWNWCISPFVKGHARPS